MSAERVSALPCLLAKVPELVVNVWELLGLLQFLEECVALPAHLQPQRLGSEAAVKAILAGTICVRIVGCPGAVGQQATEQRATLNGAFQPRGAGAGRASLSGISAWGECSQVPFNMVEPSCRTSPPTQEVWSHPLAPRPFWDVEGISSESQGLNKRLRVDP